MTLIINTAYMGYFGKQTQKCDCKCIVIHHTATSSPKRTREALMKKNCSTHFEVDQSGNIYQYREENLQCSHCGSTNCHAIGIDITHVTGKEFPEEQLKAVRELLKYLCDKWNIRYEVYERLDGIYFHRAIGNTICPDNLTADDIALLE